MEAIIIILLLAHLISIIIIELVLFSLPFEYKEDWKRVFIVGTPVNFVFNFFVYYRLMKSNFSPRFFMGLKNLITLNCSYQDIARLASSCLKSLAVSIVISVVMYIYIKRKYDSTEKFRFFSPLLVLIFIAIVPIMIGYQISRTGYDHISINEICRKTTSISSSNSLSDDQYADDEEASFVVIKNDGKLSFDAYQLFLSDNELDLQYIRINGDRIHPGGTYTFIMSSDDAMNIKKKGGTIVYLSNLEGKILDSVAVPALARDESYQNNNDCWEIVSLKEDNTEIPEVTAPIFSADSGFYENDFYLSLSADEGATIYYTLDCTDPSLEANSYSRPIHIYNKSSEPNKYRSIQNVQPIYKMLEEIGTEPVDKAFVVRAMAVDEEGNQSKIVTKTFWVDLEQYKDKTVVSLVTDPDNLFDEQNGIYVNGQEYEEWYSQALNNGEKTSSIDGPTPNYKQRGEEWEREANCEIFNGSEIILDQPVGIRIQGASNRKFALKRFSVYSRKKYSGSKWFDIPLISDEKIHSFVLRDGFTNAFVPTLVEDRDISIQHSKAVDVFLDGEYWYSVYLLEKYSNSYFQEYYNINPDNVLIVKNETDSTLLNIINAEYSSDEEAYSKINSVMDIQSYIDFICINAYLDNEDFYEKKNTITWKSIAIEDSEYGDTRWRWLLYDMDLVWNFGQRNHSIKEIPYQINTFSLGMSPSNRSKEDFTMINQPLYKGLRKNAIFCRNFVLSFMDIVNTDFQTEKVLQQLEEWGNTSKKTSDFFAYRADYIVPYMAEEFELKGTQETVTLTSNRYGESITLNTIKPFIRGKWSGKYFTDYPVTVTANYDDFDHWEITSNGITTTYYDTQVEVPVVRGGVKINAIFK